MDNFFGTMLAGLAAGILLPLSVQIARIERRSSSISRIEGKLNLLLQNAGLEYDPFADISDDLAEAVRSGKKIPAIKLYRDETSCDLKTAKRFVEGLMDRATPNG
jgi:hypothetical protein